MYLLRMAHTLYQVLFDMPKNENVTSSSLELHLTSLFKEMNIIAPAKYVSTAYLQEMSSEQSHFFCALKSCLGNPLA